MKACGVKEENVMRKSKRMLAVALATMCILGMLSFAANAYCDASYICSKECAEEGINVDAAIFPRKPGCPNCNGDTVRYTDSNTYTPPCPLNSKYTHYHYIEAVYWKCSKCGLGCGLDHVINEFWMCDSSLSGKCDALP